MKKIVIGIIIAFMFLIGNAHAFYNTMSSEEIYGYPFANYGRFVNHYDGRIYSYITFVDSIPYELCAYSEKHDLIAVKSGKYLRFYDANFETGYIYTEIDRNADELIWTDNYLLAKIGKRIDIYAIWGAKIYEDYIYENTTFCVSKGRYIYCLRNNHTIDKWTDSIYHISSFDLDFNPYMIFEANGKIFVCNDTKCEKISTSLTKECEFFTRGKYVDWIAYSNVVNAYFVYSRKWSDVYDRDQMYLQKISTTCSEEAYISSETQTDERIYSPAIYHQNVFLLAILNSAHALKLDSDLMEYDSMDLEINGVSYFPGIRINDGIIQGSVWYGTQFYGYYTFQRFVLYSCSDPCISGDFLEMYCTAYDNSKQAERLVHVVLERQHPETTSTTPVTTILDTTTTFQQTTSTISETTIPYPPDTTIPAETETTLSFQDEYYRELLGRLREEERTSGVGKSSESGDERESESGDLGSDFGSSFRIGKTEHESEIIEFIEFLFYILPLIIVFSFVYSIYIAWKQK